MTCAYPKKGFVVGLTPTGKNKIKICSYQTYYCINDKGDKVFDYYTIPCGKCFSCRLAYSKEWAVRCMLESSFYDSNYFVTLTYDENHNTRQLIKDDLRYFIKKLRIYLARSGKPEIRFFACGEYGSKTLRPHFHLIIFNLILDDLKPLKTSKTGFQLFKSDFLSSIWDKGFVQVGYCTLKSCGYVARYCLKGISNSMLEDIGLNKEFILMSRRPGLGFGFFDKNKESIYNTDKIYFNFGDSATSSVPHYFDYLMTKLDPSIVSQIKDRRKLKAEWNFFLEFMQTSLLDDIEYLKIKNDSKIERFKLYKDRSAI